MAIDKAIAQLDEIIGQVEEMCGDAAPPLRADPDDPWGACMATSSSVSKVRCSGCGNLLTLPFEKQCPMPSCFKGDTSYLVLKPVLKPKAGSGGGSGGGGGSGDGGGGGGGDGAPKKEKKEKKEKKPAPSAAPAGGGGNENQEVFHKTKIMVGKITEIEPLEGSDKLYKTQVDIGGGETRQVVAGLQKFIPAGELLGKNVCVVCNLKPAKLAGTPSQAMILAADTADPSHPEGRAVKTVEPPAGSEPGDRIYVGGTEPSPAPPKAMSSTIWAKVVPLLAVQGGKALFDAKPLVTAKGAITSSMPDGSGIH